MTSRKPGILKPRSAQPVKLSFQCDAALAERLSALERTAKSAGLEIDIDEALAATLARFIAQAEKQLSPRAEQKPDARKAQATSPQAALPDRDGHSESRTPREWQSLTEIPD